MLDSLISSKTRINLLLKFFLNPEHSSHLRGLATEFNESTNAIRLELNKFEKAGMLEAKKQGNKKIFKANPSHSLFPDIRNIVLKFAGIDQIIEHIANKLGNLQTVYLTGDWANGIQSDIIDIILIGNIDKPYLLNLIDKAEQTINKRIKYLIYEPGELDLESYAKNELLLIYGK